LLLWRLHFAAFQRHSRRCSHARPTDWRIAGRNAATDRARDGSATAELAHAGFSSECDRSEHDDSKHTGTCDDFAKRNSGSGRQRAAACTNAAFNYA
jgi:hypothetical protein